MRTLGGACLRERDLVAGGSDDWVVWDDEEARPLGAKSATKPALRGTFTLTSADGTPIECRTAFEANWDYWQTFTPEHAETICGVPAAERQPFGS